MMTSQESCCFATLAKYICFLLSSQTAFASHPTEWSKSGAYKNDNNPNNSDGSYSRSSAANDALFMVGNSYFSTNNLTSIVKNMLEHSSASASSGVNLPIVTETFDKGGAKWWDLASNPGNFTITLHSREFRWVVLQEQSETPGLYDSKYDNEFIDSKNAAQILDNLIRQRGNADGTKSTETILFQTWGRLHHDDNPTPEIAALFDSFSHHQYRLAVGYREYQKVISTPERPVVIAPVGYAFQAIHDGMEAQGLDPEQEGARFSNLYIEDGSHPSEQGSYLAASVLVGMLTGQDPREFDWDYPLVPQDIQKYLRDVAHETIANFCQTCNVAPNQKMPYLSPEERAAMDARKSSPFVKFLHFLFWCAVIGGGGSLAMVKRERLRVAWRRQLVRNAWGRSSTSNSFGYAPLSQGRGAADMELM